MTDALFNVTQYVYDNLYRRITVVEDNATLALGLRHSLESDGHLVDVIHDGQSALSSDLFLFYTFSLIKNSFSRSPNVIQAVVVFTK